MICLPSLILLSLFSICICKLMNINQKFEDIDKKTLKLNALAARLTWESSVNPSNPELITRAANYQKNRIKWQHETCDMLGEFNNQGMLNATQKRLSYLLCRGPRYTYEEARDTTYLNDELQSLYSDAEICIPSSKHISAENLEDAEAAILDYLSNVKYLSMFDQSNRTSSKLAYYRMNSKDGFCLQGEDYFDKLMRYSKNEEVLKWLWLVWREEVSAPMREHYDELVEIENRASRRNGYSDFGATWRDELEMPDLRQLCHNLYSEIRTLYKILHGVVRYYLRMHYGNIVPEHGPIPAHLLGNLWSQNWESLIDLITQKKVDLDTNIKNLNKPNNYLVKRAEDFYQSLGLPPMTSKFWRESVFARKNMLKNRCHGTAADMFKTDDFRLIYCSGTSSEDFYVIHHELGHIQYFMAYEHQPAIFRQGNTALHETIGDTIMYGVMTPQHLNRLGLLNESFLYIDTSKTHLETNLENDFTKDNKPTHKLIVEDYVIDESDDNFFSKDIDDEDANFNIKDFQTTRKAAANDLNDITTDEILMLKMALNKIPQIPFSLLIDEYRWKYFEDGIDERQVNKEFWNMARDLQGIAPPKKMGEKYFDIGAKFHVPDNTPYIRYFLSSFLQHQLFEVLCKTSVFGRRGVKENLPNTITMNRCDIYGSKAVGKVLRDLMSRGNSQHWREILLETTGIEDISASALKRYYRPLYKLLVKLIRQKNIPIGW